MHCCILLKIAILVIFKTCINFGQKMARHWVTYIDIIKRKLRKFSKILCKDVKLMYTEVCQVSRRFLLHYGCYSRIKRGRGSDPTHPLRRSRVNFIFEWKQNIRGLAVNNENVYKVSIPILRKTAEFCCFKCQKALFMLFQRTCFFPPIGAIQEVSKCDFRKFGNEAM